MTPRRALLALGSGVALALAFPEPDLGPLAWVALAPLLHLCSGERGRRAAGYGALFGAAFFGTLLAWITLVGYVAWILLVAYQTGFIVLFSGAYASVTRHVPTPVVRVAAAPVLWVAVDFLRGHVPVAGFTWGTLAQSQHELLWMLRPASLGGAWLVALVILTINALAAEAARARRARLAVAAAVLVALPLLIPANSSGGTPVRVAIVQGNVPRTFPGSGFEKELEITRSHAELTQALDPDDVDFVVWPESSMNLDYESVPEVGLLLADAARAVGRPMVVGGNRDLPGNRYGVMAFHVSPEGEVVDAYRKTHLVPFGEFVPARRLLGWIPMLEQVPRDAVAGSEHSVFDMAGGKVAPVISFEGDFGSLVRAPIAAGGRLLVVATNTSTWGDSWGSAQHVAFSRVRAVENGVWVAHAAISGISAAIAPDGRVAGSIPLWEAGTLVGEMAFADGSTLYTRTGDWVPWACAVGAVALLVWSRRWVG